MADEVLFSNTPETLGVTPRYVLMHNAISRAANSLSGTAKKLTAMAMALLPADLSSRAVSFSFNDFCKALGTSTGGESFNLFKNAANECMQCVITVETNKIVKGKRKWEKLTWFNYSSFDEETGQCKMIFSEPLTAFILEMKRLYAKIDLQDLGKLQSKYALHLFEMAKSYESLKGQSGNADQEWYFERTVPELRFILGVPEDAYKETKYFRQFAVENPVKEINGAGIGVEIKTESVKKGRKLAGIRFDCKQTGKTATRNSRDRKKTAVKQPALPGLFEKTRQTQEEKEMRHLRELYPKEFTVLYAAEMKKHTILDNGSVLKQKAAEAAALQGLREKHGIVK